MLVERSRHILRTEKIEDDFYNNFTLTLSRMTRGPLTPVTVLYVTRGCDVSELGGILNRNKLVNYEISLIFKQLQVRSSSSQVNNSDSKEKNEECEEEHRQTFSYCNLKKLFHH